MKIFCYRVMAVTAACLLLAGGTAFAFPGQNSACTNCHDDGSGSLAVNPDPLDVIAGGNGLLSFDVGTLPAPNGNNMIALEGVTVAGLAATVGAGGGNWSLDAGALADVKSDEGIGTGPYTLALDIGAGAVLGTYNLNWYLAGGAGDGALGTTGSFVINVINAVPEPTSLAMLGLGGTALAITARRRRVRRQE